MSENWTKGPWHTEGGSVVIGPDGETVVCCVRGSVDRGSQSEDWATANLIAAAPDMYEALEICLGHLTGGMDGNWADCDPADVAREALAKARGES